MHNQPLVSILINCYNGEKYIREAIDSVIAQTYANWEIIFWDNQSIDSSASIVKSYNDVRIKYYYAPTHTLLYDARKLAREYYRDLEKCYDHLTSSESIIETIEANDYEFDSESLALA